MARQIVDLNRLSNTTLSKEDLLLVRDVSQKEDKAAPLSALSDFMSSIPTDQNGMYTLRIHDGNIELIPLNLPEFDITIDNGTNTRTVHSSASFAKLGRPFLLKNPLNYKIRVHFSCHVMFMQSVGSGSGRLYIGLSDMTRLTNTNYIDLVGWSNVQLIGALDIPANSTAELFLIGKIDNGGTLSITDKLGDVGQGWTPRLVGRTVKVYG